MYTTPGSILGAVHLGLALSLITFILTRNEPRLLAYLPGVLVFVCVIFLVLQT